MRLAQFGALTLEEAQILDRLQADSYRVRRNVDILVQGCRYNSVFVLQQGVAMRYKAMPDGRRQIVNFVLPGEFMGFPACAHETALYTLSTLTDSVAAPVTFDGIRALFDRSPRLGVAMFWQSTREAAMYGERVVDIGRRSAYERVAHLLLELLCRLQIVGMSDGKSFMLPLTQELIGDALGLSAIHVNRTFRKLREAGLVNVKGHHFIIQNHAALASLADFESAYLTRTPIPGLPFSN